MTAVDDPHPGVDEDPVAGPKVDEVRDATLTLLAGLPQHPQRMRVRAGDVDVELDWRLVPAQSTAPVSTGEPGPAQATTPEEGADRHFVCAPTVGTFYRAPEPGAAPFVVEGAPVKPGQQIGIIEAMKLMLSVEADRTGRVIEVLAENGQSVEYGQRLFAIEPDD